MAMLSTAASPAVSPAHGHLPKAPADHPQTRFTVLNLKRNSLPIRAKRVGFAGGQSTLARARRFG
jgi:hypothetical protein